MPNIGTATPKKLAAPGLLQTGLGTIYTVGTPMTTRVTSLTLTNFSSSAVICALNYVPAGGAAGSTNSICLTNIPPDGYPVEILQPGAETYLNASDFLTGTASVGSAVVYNISGVELQ